MKVEQPGQSRLLVPGHAIPVSGWVLAHEPIKSITIQIGGKKKTARFGLPRPDLVRLFPGVALVARAGFQCLIPPDFNPDADRLTVTVQTSGGAKQQTDVALTFVSAEEAADISAEARNRAENSKEAVHLSIDQAIVDSTGLLRVGGWALAHGRIDSINVYADDRLIGQAQLGLNREDVALSWPDFPQAFTSGFLLVTDAQHLAGDVEVTIDVRTLGGVSRAMTVPVERSETLRRRRAVEALRLECDQAVLKTSGQLYLKGWAVSSAGIDHIDIIFEGEIIGEADFGQERPDVGNAFPTITGARNAGFQFQGVIDPVKLRDEHLVELRMCLNDGSKPIFKVGVAPQQGAAVETANASGGNDILLFIDDPLVKDGRAVNPITGGFSMVGWSLASAGIEDVTIDLDGTKVGLAYYGMRREDIEAAFPDRSNTLLSGFAFTLPRRGLTAGEHQITVTARDKAQHKNTVDFMIEVSEADEPDGPWALRRRMPAAEQLLIEAFLKQMQKPQAFIIWLDFGNDPSALRSTLRSLKDQVYSNWQIVSSKRTIPKVIQKLISQEFPDFADKIQMSASVAAANFSKTRDTGSIWIMSLEAGDELAVDALSELALAAATNPKSEFIYSDERLINPASGKVEAFFKPDWSPDLLSSTNYLGKAWCVRLDLLQRVQRPMTDFGIFGSYDLALHCTEEAAFIDHVPKVLFESVKRHSNRNLKDKLALERAVKRRKLNAEVLPGRIENTFKIRPAERPKGLVSIIIPTCAARGLVKICLNSLRELSTYKDIEIICIDNILDPANEWKAWLRENSDIVVEILEPFNWSRFNNLAAAEASGSYLLFLNDDIEVLQPDWMESMLVLAADPAVGVVGPQLLYPDRKVQHAGLFLSGLGTARHAFRFCEADDSAYFGLALTQRNVIAVTGACMLLRREVFDRVGGFAEEHAVVNNDLDFCLKIYALGLRNVFTPNAQLVHHELASRAHMKDVHDTTAFNSQWASLFHSGDPFFHRHLSRSHDPYQYEVEPEQLVFSGHPYYLKRDVRRILAIKVDHIGDFLTALPAFKRIKERFPDCRLSVLAAPSAVHLAGLEPAIDEIIPFEFFHARSGLGQKEVEEDELEELKIKLSAMNFDLAMDLRKHPDTRKLLQYTGAKILAGFEANHAYPWLDIARPFEGDERFVNKHMHVTDDIICLVDQVAAAGEIERSGLERYDTFDDRKQSIIARFADGLFDRPLVCVHPASGTELRQWPPSFFAGLIDLLVETEDVNIAVIGSPDEAEIAERMMSFVSHKERVTLLIGALKLAELPYFIASCALFVGNNSGPHHIAASVGVPTVGIHSGVVDAHEWGPLGPLGLAIRKEMTCAPCYLAKLEDCHRALACLTQLSPSVVLAECKRLLSFK